MKNSMTATLAEPKVQASGVELPEPPEKVSILLVDDQPQKLLANEAILTSLGQNIIKARSGREALEHLLKHDVAVILLDINMPEMDGFETAAMIRGRPRFERIPIIFVSAYNTTDIDRLKGYDLGAVDYLFLPIVPEVLKAKVLVFVELAKQTAVIKRQAERLGDQNRVLQDQIQTIQELNKKLTAANQELESFSYSVSHDLRSPLRTMQGFSQILLDEYASQMDEEAQDYLKRINKASMRMDALIRDILTYSRVSKADFVTKELDLEVLVADILKENGRLRESQAKFVIRSPLAKVLGHEACLVQCLTNLFENGVKFVPKDRMPELLIRTEPRGANVRLWIQDNGIGIDPLHHEKIFQMFERLHDGKDYDGTGIGLAIVKKGIERMGGIIGIESTLGVGSKFWIELPSPDGATAPTGTVARGKNS
jgi:signal transduction histidine kinase